MNLPPPTAKTIAIIAAIGVAIPFVTATSMAQTVVAPPPKLADFREAFESAVETRSSPARESFAAALAELMRSRADHGDYEGAIRARDRRLELLASKPEATGDPASREGEIAIDLPSASRSGSGLKYDVRESKFVGLTKDNQSLLWEISKTVPGVYSAIVTYSCGEPEIDPDTEAPIKTGGSFTLAETTNLTTSGSEPLVRVVVPTGGWDESITRNIGKITVTGTRLNLQLSVDQANPGGLMHLYGIRLVPFDDGLGTGGSAGAETPEELAVLRERFRLAITPKTSPIIMSYGTALREILDNASVATQLEEALEAQAAFTTAEKLSKDPTLIYRDPLPDS